MASDSGPASAPDPPDRLAPALVALLATAMLLNYADRGSLSVAAPALKDTFGIDNAVMGVVLSSFFWSYALAQPAAGWITQRWSPRIVLAAGVGLWALATIGCGLATSLTALIALRLLLGIGESVIFPVNACILAAAPETKRGTANGMISLGSYAGPAVGTFVGGMILLALGWRAVFWVLGGVTLLWLVPWLTASRRLLGQCADPHPDPAPYCEILRTPALWAASIGQFCYSYPFYLTLTWMPLYLVKTLHYSVGAMTTVGVAVYACQGLSAALTGIASDALIARGHTATAMRKGFLVTGMAGSGSCIAIVGAMPALAAPMFVLGALFTGLSGPMVFTIGQSLAGPRAGGRWMGIQNMVGNFSGILAPIATGWLADRTGSFAAGFGLAAALSGVGIVSWLLFVGPVRPVPWRPAAWRPVATA